MMAVPRLGKGYDYGVRYLDSAGQPFDGSKTYEVEIPAKKPVADFWAFTIYDNQTRSTLRSNQKRRGSRPDEASFSAAYFACITVAASSRITRPFM